ncbi:alpha/beta fold hydrolase [Xylanimonas sp. McL0601]|uniref:alpha/beta fold hydrolase n=1 Tax=Xylanimonas sp. McL0601 TaxID=3414739 RepID=UPI003CF101D8
MATFALIHGGGSSSWDWHLVAPALQGAGHRTVAVDLPVEDPSAGWDDYVDTVAAGVGDAPQRPLVVVGHSLGAFTAPLAAAHLDADLVVLLAGMVPAPGETFGQWWERTGYVSTGDDDVFYRDVTPALAAEARAHARGEESAALAQPWPLSAWPTAPTRFALFRDDRMFEPVFMRRLARERLGLDADELPGGHYALISRPDDVADYLLRLVSPALPGTASAAGSPS